MYSARINCVGCVQCSINCIGCVQCSINCVGCVRYRINCVGCVQCSINCVGCVQYRINCVGCVQYRINCVKCVQGGFRLVEKVGDLFACASDEHGVTPSLAHCVSVDLRMGAGIAKLFRNNFGRVPELVKQGVFVILFYLFYFLFLSIIFIQLKMHNKLK